MRIIAAPDRRVRDPETKALVPDDGQEVSEHDVYWARLLADGDVVPAPETPAEPAPSQEEQE
ncbi:DUF2635 domain-containing protein [Flavisphingomonas formosensis]|uniref:DUF2635 domain-containing protein n=1 Tax=Flavisphingomonas formosensis TaxID=861534 RepID=UPI0012F777D3|nr:DUF2635 domain-containing protein [Sphingomonas formosensis]